MLNGSQTLIPSVRHTLGPQPPDLVVRKPELRQHGHIPAEAATQQLLTAVNVEIERGNYDVATASIERVLQINPDDAWAWHKLALLHFVRENYTQAKSIALRSNALPSATGRVAAANWFLIGTET